MTDPQQIDYLTAYRRLFFAEQATGLDGYAKIVLADLIDQCGVFEDLFANGDRPAPDVDNAYLEGRRSIGIWVLARLGITGPGQAKKIVEVLPAVRVADLDLQEMADGGLSE